jgi:hypothetical protein
MNPAPEILRAYCEADVRTTMKLAEYMPKKRQWRPPPSASGEVVRKPRRAQGHLK